MSYWRIEIRIIVIESSKYVGGVNNEHWGVEFVPLEGGK